MAAIGAVLLLACLPLACSEPPGKLYSGRGTVRDVSAKHGQVVLESEEIPGLMPAMTMNFDVPDPKLLGKLEKGQVVDFALRVRGERYQIVGASIVDQKEVDAVAQGPHAKIAVEGELAAPFEGIDQDGAPVSLASLRGRIVLLDFVYTHCPGPCPILTGILVSLQRKLPQDLRERTHFVSITLDPERDTPEVLRAYAGARGADLSGWSFVTGKPEQIDAVLAAYGVGRTQGSGEIQHTLVTYLIDGEGRIVRRYTGLSHAPEEMLHDLRALARGSGAVSPREAAPARGSS